jgi:hypothetical protein
MSPLQFACLCPLHYFPIRWIEHGLLPAIQIPRLGRLINEKDLAEFMQKERPTGYPKGKPRK